MPERAWGQSDTDPSANFANIRKWWGKIVVKAKDMHFSHMARTIKWLVFLAFLISGQLSLASAQTQFQFTPNPKLLTGWDKAISHGKYISPPYLVKFSTGSKSLWFIAADHTNNVESPTFKLIEKAFAEFKPQALIIEGAERQSDLSAESYKFLVRDSKLWKTKIWSGESAYAVAFAIKHKIACISGEPSDEYIKTHLSKKFTPNDLLCFYLVRAMPKRDRNVNFDEWFTEHTPLINIDAKRIGVKLPSVNKFKSWYKNKNKKTFNIGEIDYNEAAPYAGENALFTQQLSYNVSVIRNTTILETIAAMLNQYDKVLVLYGSGHFQQQADALENMLGRANIIKNALEPNSK